MFSEHRDTIILEPHLITERIARDITILLRKQHSGSDEATIQSLREDTLTSRVAVTLQDDRVIAIGVLVLSRPLSHRLATFHNLVVWENIPFLARGMAIVEVLLKFVPNGYEIEAESRETNPEMAQILLASGFVSTGRVRFRLSR